MWCWRLYHRRLSSIGAVQQTNFRNTCKRGKLYKKNRFMALTENNPFLFFPKYRVHRHFIYWTLYLLMWVCYWTILHYTFARNLFIMLVWLPLLLVYSYPLGYVVIPRLLLKSRYFVFGVFVIAWALLGWYANVYFRGAIFIPLQEWIGFSEINRIAADPGSFLCMTTTAACLSATTLVKRWMQKQQEWMKAVKEKATAQMELLKAQLHPHFLFNTLNNIYAFALENSPKTPQMILKLSSLLSYMLYDCKADEVLLEKEVEVMKHYMDLEKERYGERIEISVNIEGDICDKYITPLLILPFLENAFKHGTSEQLHMAWMSVDIAVEDYLLKCKVVNSKNESQSFQEDGVGISNLKKRLELLYQGQYDLKLADEGEFFAASLVLQLNGNGAPKLSFIQPRQRTTVYT
jgi:two-component system, LytTR family, sensor histidine kinase AlgZ